uniref:Zinc finger protein, FOG family member 1 n=1 Tax=Neogobius melanostomus TaxID=47308 RepID=A0A8C6WYC6_9GOBI
MAGENLLASLSGSPISSLDPQEQLSPPLSLVTHKQQPVVKEEPLYPAALHSEIQLLPQQAGMAAILATAVINKDIFPCKDCGIWYRSERNLQAHLMYYCASRQKQPSAASSPPQDKPKECYPNERICPFPQCNKSCPSASSLEIHMRTHSGERPFVCLICLSAFTTKANCERHLKVHTDTVNGVCLGCGFVSTTRDILYSHLVTSHMVCQPGSRSEVYSPGPGLPKLPLSIGKWCCIMLRVPAERSPTPRQSTPSSDQSQPHMSPKEREALACVPKPESPNLQFSKKSSHHSKSRAQKSNSWFEPCTCRRCRVGPSRGALFLPQYMFNAEAAILPQASEILAKMSEMVHCRIKQGQALPPNSATCFQCDITFNNINNYYVHKRLYCSSRHQTEPSTAPANVPSAGASTSPQGGSQSEATVGREGTTSSPDVDGASVGAGGGRASEGSQSPASGSAEDQEDDLNKTFCVACNIRFSRHENYTVHKRFYCASRHDPSNHRSVHMAKSNATPFMPQPIRTRKRKKMYEIHMALAASAAASAPSPSVLGLSLKPEMSPNGTEASSPEGDGPIDLSKRPRRTEVSRHSSSLLPALPLSDYHKCTACSISFNSIENYLAHKTYYCPVGSCSPVTCPYCPNRPLTGDLMEHFKSVHGLVVKVKSPRDMSPCKSPMDENPSEPSGGTRASSLTVSPLPEVKKESHTGDEASCPVAAPKTQAISPVQNGNSRFCRLCNIKFSSLSTFIAHKKYYCSSHSAEHVK